MTATDATSSQPFAFVGSARNRPVIYRHRPRQLRVAVPRHGDYLGHNVGGWVTGPTPADEWACLIARIAQWWADRCEPPELRACRSDPAIQGVYKTQYAQWMRTSMGSRCLSEMDEPTQEAARAHFCVTRVTATSTLWEDIEAAFTEWKDSTVGLQVAAGIDQVAPDLGRHRATWKCCRTTLDNRGCEGWLAKDRAAAPGLLGGTDAPLAEVS